MPLGGQWDQGTILQILLVDFIPDAAEVGQTQTLDHLAPLTVPGHSRLLETLREDDLAPRFRDAASQRQSVPLVRAVGHFLAVLEQIIYASR